MKNTEVIHPPINKIILTLLIDRLIFLMKNSPIRFFN